MSAPEIPRPVVTHPAIRQWLDFASEGRVLLRSGKIEIGQGIGTAFTQIAADELDVDPARIDLVAGDTRATADEGYTSGSLSMESGGMAIRFAASAARRLLLGEAARLLQARIDDLTVVDGRVHVGGRESDLDYWTLAKSADPGASIADHAAPKLPAERRLSGRTLARIDLPAKLRGAPSYIQDLEIDGMVHARILNPPAPSCRLIEFDEAAIRALPGVIAIARDGSYAAVIAAREDEAIRACERAARLCRWSEPGNAPADPIAAIGTTIVEPVTGFERGNTTGAVGRRFSTVVSRPYLSHGSIGPSCALASWADGRLTVHTHSQGVFPLRRALSGVFALSEDAIDVIHVPGAGCYGHNGADDAALDAALAARAVPGRTVRMQWSRADEFRRSPLAPAMVTRAEAVVGPDGLMTSFDVEVKSPPHTSRPVGAAAVNLLAAAHLQKPILSPFPSEPAFAVGGSSDRNSLPLYSIANVRSRKRVIHDLPWRTSAMRGLGAFVNVFAIETLIDDIAADLGRDPLDYRFAHAQDPRIRVVLERVAAMAGWPDTTGEGAALGLAFSRYKNSGAYCAVITRIELGDEVRVTDAWAAVDAGEAVNPDGIANQIEGGIVQATSWTLKEAIRFDGEAVESVDWESYPILGFAETPRTFVEIIDRPDLQPLGVGEAAHGPTVAAIGNAVFRAAGVRIRDLPITRTRIVAALA